MSQVQMPKSTRCYVEISRSQIAANYRAVRDAVGPGGQVIGVVKADAYGHGAVEVSRVLCREGAAWLAVSPSKRALPCAAPGSLAASS